MIETSGGGTAALRPLIPSHGDWIQRMQVSVDVGGTLASKDDDTRACQHRRVAVATGRRRARNLRLYPARGVHIQNVCVIEVLETAFLAFIEVTAEDD